MALMPLPPLIGFLPRCCRTRPVDDSHPYCGNAWHMTYRKRVRDPYKIPVAGPPSWSLVRGSIPERPISLLLLLEKAHIRFGEKEASANETKKENRGKIKKIKKKDHPESVTISGAVLIETQYHLVLLCFQQRCWFTFLLVLDIYTYIHIYTYVPIYIYVCVCVCASRSIYIYIYIICLYIYIHMYLNVGGMQWRPSHWILGTILNWTFPKANHLATRKSWVPVI